MRKSALVHLGRINPFGRARVATLYARGPSLDTHDFTHDPGAHLAINEAVLVAPTLMGIAWDYEPVLRIGRALKFRGINPEAGPPWMIVVEDIFDGRAGPDVEWVRERGSYYRREDVRSYRPGTAAIALALLAQGGVQEVHMVGFDAYFHPEVLDRPAVDAVALPEGSGVGVARRTSERVKKWVDAFPGPDKAGTNWQANYREINKVISRVAGEYGLRLVEGK